MSDIFSSSGWYSMPTHAGRTRLRMKWEYPGPIQASFRLAAMEGWFLDTEEFVFAAKEIAIRDMDRKFETETDPRGVKWAKLVEPSPFQISILRLTGDMYKAAIDQTTWEVTPRGLYFHTEMLPTTEVIRGTMGRKIMSGSHGTPYWIFHEQPQGSGEHKRLPRRSFIPLSNQAREEIDALYAAWVDRGIELGSRGKVGVFRNPRGQFASFG